MRVCLAKRSDEWRIFPYSLSFETLRLMEDKVFDECSDLPFLGFLYGLQADFIVWDGSSLRPFQQYDVIITLSPILKERPNNGQYLFYMQPEPTDDLVHVQYPYDGILSNYALRQDSPRVFPFWYRYPVQLIRNHSLPKQDLVFLQKRTNLSCLHSPRLRSLLNKLLKRRSDTFFVTFSNRKFRILTEQWGQFSYIEHFNRLSQCQFFLNLDDRPSAGQLIAEAAILGVPSLARSEKLFQQLLFPQLCHVTSEAELIATGELLSCNVQLYDEVLEQVEKNLHYIDYSGVLSQLEQVVEAVS